MNIVEVNAPSSKSVSHRALIASALSNGQSLVMSPLDSRDLTRTKGCLTAIGATMDEKGGNVLVTGMENGPVGGEDTPVALDMEESGTTCRLMTGVAAAGTGKFRVYGAGRMHERPIGGLTEVLEKLGVKFTWENKAGYPPFIMESEGLTGGEVDISLEESSQYLSGLLLAAPLAKTSTTINVVGEKAVSWPYVALTLQIMEDYKVPATVEVLEDGAWKQVPWKTVKSVTPGQVRFKVQPGEYQSADYKVEADWSNGSYFLAAGAIGPLPVRVNNLSVSSLQGDRAILDILTQMGGRAEWDGDSVTMRPSKLKGLELDMGRCPDIVMTVAVAAAFAEGPTTIRNVAHLRIKESDRLMATATEIAKTGCEVDLHEDGLTVRPRPIAPGKRINFATYGDHRLAMSMALFGLAGVDGRFDDKACVAKSFPGYWEEFAKITKAL